VLPVLVLVLSLELLLLLLAAPLLLEQASMTTGASAVNPRNFTPFFKKSFLSIMFNFRSEQLVSVCFILQGYVTCGVKVAYGGVKRVI
jgi:hypothetical protein